MKKQIEKWLNEGLIDNRQAKQMLADIEKEASEKSSKKIIFAFSIIGSVLAGTGAILFIAANWQQIPHLVKIISLAAMTFAAAYSGYYLEYENKNYPKTGSSLLFLSTMLFGVLIFLTAQAYHVESSGRLHILVLIWLISILPFIYLFKSKAVSVLSCALFYLWLGTFVFTRNIFGNAEHSLILFACCTAIFTFSFGKLQNFITGFEDLSSVFEKISVFILFFALFLMTFSFLAKPYSFGSGFGDNAFIFTKIHDLLLLAPAVILLLSFIFNPAKRKSDKVEIIFMLCMFSFCILLSNIALTERVFAAKNDFHYYSFYPELKLFTNLFFAISALGLIFSGYLRKRMFYVNLGVFWLTIFLIFKYFDFFWRLLPRSAFFLTGGIALVGLALFIEHKRRTIKTEFKQSE